MVVNHSSEDIEAALSGISTFCNICNEPLNAVDIRTVVPCMHKFHNRCIIEHLQETNLCPICKTQCELQPTSSSTNNLQAEISAAEQIRNTDEQQYARPAGTRTRRGRGNGQRRGMITRSQRLEIPNQPALNLTNSTTSHLNTSSQREEITSVVRCEMQNCQRQLMQKLTSVIQTQLATMQLGSNTRSNAGISPIENIDLSAPANHCPFVCTDHSYAATGNDNSQQASGVSNRSHVSVHQDKVPTIIQSWRIKFDGSEVR